MTTRRFLIAIFLAALAGGFLFPAFSAKADWEGWCWFGVGPGCHDHPHPAPPPPPPPPVPTIEVVCDGKDLKGMAAHFQESFVTPCTDINNLKPGEEFTVLGRNFRPSSKYTEYGFRNSAGSTPGGEFFPYSSKPGDVFVNADGNGNFTAIANVTYSFGQMLGFPYGIYPFKVVMQSYDSQKGKVLEIAIKDLNVVAKPAPPPPPPPPPPPNPTPTQTPTPAPVKPDLILEFDTNKTTLKAGDTLFVRGRYFTPGLSVISLWFMAGDKIEKAGFTPVVLVRADGSFEGTVTIPQRIYSLMPAGATEVKITTKTITINNFVSIPETQKQTYTLVASCPPGPGEFIPADQAITFSEQKTALAFNVKGFTCGDPLAAGARFDGAADKNDLLTINADQSFDYGGASSLSLGFFNDGTILPAVSQVVFTVSDAHGRSASAHIKLNHDFPVALYPNRANPGDIVKITSWRGLATNSRANIYFDATRLKSAFLSADYPEFQVPLSATNGWHWVKLTSFDGLGRGIMAPIEIYGAKEKPDPALQVEPAAVLSGESVMAIGKGWSAGSKKIAVTSADGKELTLENPRNLCLKALDGMGCEAGELRYSLTIPKTAAAGSYFVTAVSADGKEKARAEFKVLAAEKINSQNGPKIILNPDNGPAGMIIVASGAGFAPNSGLTGTFDGEKLALENNAAQTDANGSFISTITIPAGAAVGGHPVTFSTGANQTGGVPSGELRLSGKYRCFTSANDPICRVGPPIIFNADGTYAFSTDKGTYRTEGNSVWLSQSKIWGRGEFSENFLRLEFKLKTDDQRTIATYLLEDRSVSPVIGGGAQKSDSASTTFTVTKKTEDKATGGEGDGQTGDGGKAGGESTKNYGEIEAPKFGEVETKTYGEIGTKRFGEVKTKIYGEEKTNTYGGVEIKGFGGVEIKAFSSGVETKNYGEVETKKYGDVPAPSFDQPNTAPGECNPDIPLYSQPGCKPRSSIQGKEAATASIFSAMRDTFVRWLRPKPKKATLPTGGEPSAEPMNPSLPALESSKQPSSPASSKSAAPQAPSTPAKKSAPPSSAPQPKNNSTATPRPDLTGSYRCFSYNVSGGGGGNCRLFSPIVLKSNGTYSVSSEKGTYRVSGDTIILSESKLRGPGKLLEGNLQIRFEYDYNGWHHVITYLKEDSTPPKDESSAASTSPAVKKVELTLHIIFPAGDYSADSVNSATLISKETGAQAAQSLAYALDRQTIEAWFSKRPPKEGIATGSVYKVMVGSGFGEDWQVGELDLTGAVTDGVTITLDAKKY